MGLKAQSLGCVGSTVRSFGSALCLHGVGPQFGLIRAFWVCGVFWGLVLQVQGVRRLGLMGVRFVKRPLTGA